MNREICEIREKTRFRVFRVFRGLSGPLVVPSRRDLDFGFGFLAAAERSWLLQCRDWESASFSAFVAFLRFSQALNLVAARLRWGF
jgi:hypothetical protein